VTLVLLELVLFAHSTLSAAKAFLFAFDLNASSFQKCLGNS